MDVDVQKARRVAPVPSLRFGEGAPSGLVLRVDHDAGTLGRRQDNVYIVDHPGVSRVHAELRRSGTTMFLTDLGSSSGTTLNGEPVHGPTMLHHGDRVGFGQATATFEDPAAAAEPEDPTLVFAMPRIERGPHLSPRQQQVIELVADGMTNAQIGEQLGITERTVKAYAQELFDKLGVRNRAGAVAQAWQLGLLADALGTQGSPPALSRSTSRSAQEAPRHPRDKVEVMPVFAAKRDG